MVVPVEEWIGEQYGMRRAVLMVWMSCGRRRGRGRSMAIKSLVYTLVGGGGRVSRDKSVEEQI